MKHSVRSAFVIVSIGLLLSGCGHRYITSRSTNPLIEDRVRLGHSDQQKMSVLTSRADRRTILLFGPGQVCAEPPPDVAEAVFSQAVAEISTKNINAGIGSTLQTALLQLTRRSQGLDYYRTGAFVNCMMHYTGALTRDEYVAAMDKLLDESVKLTMAEIEHLPDIASSPVQVENASSVTVNVDSIGQTSDSDEPDEAGDGGEDDANDEGAAAGT